MGAQLTLQWQDNSVNEAGFCVERRLTSGTDADFVQIDLVARNVTTYVDTNVQSGVNYTYRVRAYNQTANSAYTPNVSGIAKLSQTINFPAINPCVYGDPAFTVTAAASSNLPVTLVSSNTAVATVNGLTVTIVGAGSVDITAQQSGDGTYAAAPSVTQTLVISKAPLTVTAVDATRVYGAANPSFTTNITGFKNSETTAALLSQPTAGTTANATSPVGTYAITPAGGSSNNYSFSYVNGTLTITKATATVSLGNLAATYSGSAQAATATTTPSGLATALTYNGSSTVPSAAGSYTVAATVNDTNYQGSATNTLVISKATPTITWTAPAAITYGTALTGTQLNATAGIPGSFSYTPAAGTVLGAGSRTLSTTFTPTDTANYNSASQTTSLTVNPASVTVTANDLSRAYNVANPTFTFSYTGFVNGDTSAVLTTAPTATTTAIANSPAGTSYPIVPGGAAAGNYTFAYVNGTLSITKATATVTLSNLSQVADGSGKQITVTTTPTGLAYAVTYDGVATLPTAVGAHAVVVTVNDTNYSGSATDTLTLTSPMPPQITSATSASGNVGIPFTYTITALNGPTSFAATGLPANLTLNATTGAITGTPAATSTSSVTLTASNTAGTSTPVTLTLTINPQPVPVITSAATASATAGSSFSYTITASNNPTSFAATGLPTGLSLNSTTGAITGVPSAAGTATVSLTATNAGGTSTPVTLTLTVASAPPPPPPPPTTSAPSITSQPTGRTVEVGASVTFSVAATGSPTPTYQWRFNGVAIAGATGADYTKNNVQATDAGSYDVVVSNSAGSRTSNAATLVVNSAPVITAQPKGGSIAAGASATFSVTAVGTAPLTYQWRKSGTPIAGASGATFTLGSASAADAGSYDVVITNSLGTKTSDPALLTVNAPSFAGEYFGTLSGGGTWALHVRSDNTGTYLASLPDRQSAIVVEVVVDSSGHFTATGSELGAITTSAVTVPGTPVRAAAVASFTLSGSISGGQVSGQLSGINESLSGSADTGTSATAGFYTASALGATTGTTYSVVGASGRALVVTTTARGADSASGSLSSSGALTTKTTSGADLSLTVDATKNAIAASYAAVGAAPLQFSGLADSVAVTTRLVNLSVRAGAGSGSNTLIVGFVVGGGSKSVLVRGTGPALAAYGVTGTLPDPVLNVSAGSTSVATNDDWSTGSSAAQVASVAAALSAFPLTQGSADAALVTSLDTGVYTAQVTGKGAATGVALAEIYDAAKTTGARLVNVSARAVAGTGANVLIGGFTVEGNAPRQYLIRAIGPTLSLFGVSGALADPQLTIQRQGSSTPLYQNDDWGGTAALKAAFTSVSAFGLADNSKDAAAIVTLDPGSYSAVVAGANGTTGVALIEIYELP